MSLTEVAYTSRKLIKFGSFILVAIAIVWPIYMASVLAYKKAHPPYIPPTLKYGILPKITFPEKKFEKKNFTFELPNDAIPKFKDQLKVYVVYKPTSSFLALEYYTKTAKGFGFTLPPEEISPGIYKFENANSKKTLTINVLDGSFKLEYPYQTDQLLLNPQKIPTKEEAIRTAISFLESGGKMTDDLRNGEQKTTYWKIEFNGLRAVTSPSEANVIRVDFFRKKTDDNLQILSSEKDKAPVSILVSGSTVEEKKIIDVSYKYANIDRESFSTYLVKTTEQAMNDLKAGNYWPVSDISSKDVVIRKIYLAYFEPSGPTNYMQPVFVFEGDNNFTAYVPAVVDQYTK